MPLAITEDHQSLADVARAFLRDSKVSAQARAALESPEAPSSRGDFWTRMAGMGWTGLHLPEEFGGEGAGLEELAVVVEELGRSVVPGPFLASAVASATIDRAGSDAQRARWLPGFADGSTVAGIALTPAAPGVVRTADGLAGDAGPALAGRAADVLLVVSGDDVVVVAATAEGVTVEPVTALDPTQDLARVRLAGVAVTEDDVLPGAAALLTRLARTLGAAEASGGARAALDMALEYAKVREQFGRIIGSFQAIKHHLAEMLVRAELAVAVAWDAARADGSPEQAALAADVAAAIALDAYITNAQVNIQIHGGIGFTWEHDAHLFLRRASSLAALVGPGDAARRSVYAQTLSGTRRAYGVDLPEEAEQYRVEARAFVERFDATPEADRRALLATSGYLMPHWSPPYGLGAGPVQQLVLEEELAGISMPNLGIGSWLVLTLTQQASPEQVERWVAPSLAGELRWCQLFSEPGAGSDAAAVSTKGVRVEGGWLVNGQKVWTSDAMNCNRGLATVRTNPDAPKHKGITAMAIDMKAPGVQVRPLREITGEALFNEVFFDDVFIPDSDVVGEVDNGWTVARATLGNERVTIGGGSREGLAATELTELAEKFAPGDGAATVAVGALIAEEQAMVLLNLRAVARALASTGPGPEGNITKLLSAEHAQRVTEEGMRIAGPAAVIGETPELTFEYLFDRCLTIAGGTSEITRNVIAERILGLPRDPLNR
ncbi:acyl-CoA dehydrogenase [Blastococcus sp. CT_GayMR16]|uniref:acyl-CoA dehydrogenase n=1 Tax=Blastococcus sp. CT_GayMR16 TaxID=2559607 RepID=UPI0010749726|nr:acyl-CoA dehydrogenase [Blastococcus sp. CT_GayMR16]TFV88856.1 acyl-CoA dehydrogenase [Blastococcus sp. CT_GayMR16]